MSHITVLGAGVIGQVYAGLLAEAGHEVSLVARGQRREHLRSAGVVLQDGEHARRPRCRIVASLGDAGPVDVLFVAVRGDQLSSVVADVAASEASTVVCLANPLGERESFQQQVGQERVVLAFSGVGGYVDHDGVVHHHVVRQQPTVVDVAAHGGSAVAELLAGTGLPVRQETQMPAWLDTHTLFIAGVGAAVLAAREGAPDVATSRSRARELVRAIGDGFDALQESGCAVRPPALRAIFGRVPTWFAGRYWQRQFAGPTVRVSIEPHVIATRSSEFPQLADRAIGLVGERAPRYRQLVEPWESHHNR